MNTVTAPQRASVRIDDDVIDIRARRFLRTVTRRRAIAPGTAPQEALLEILATSSLLRSGRHLRLQVVLESARATFVSEPTAGTRPRVRVELPGQLLAGLEGAVARRRVRGPATLELGPLARADRAIALDADAADGTGAIVDRSGAAVTVLLVGPTGLLWGRTAPADDPELAARLLIDRARSQLPTDGGLRWWGLHDVAGGDGLIDRRRRNEFAAAVAHELEDIPLRPSSLQALSPGTRPEAFPATSPEVTV
jgi:hypothetical protein